MAAGVFIHLTQTLVGVVSGCSPPRSVIVERLADIAVVALRVMLAVTHQLSSTVLHTLAGVAVTFTPTGTKTHLLHLDKNSTDMMLVRPALMKNNVGGACVGQ